MHKKTKFYNRIDVRVLFLLLAICTITAVVVSFIISSNVRRIFVDNYEQRILQSNISMANFLSGEDVTYFIELMRNQDDDFKQRQVQFYYDRNELFELQEAGASEQDQQAVMDRLIEFHEQTASLKNDRYWHIIRDLRALRDTGYSTYVYVLAYTGLYTHDGEKLYTFIFDAQDSHTFESFDTDGLGTCINGEQALEDTFITGATMEHVLYYDGGYGELYYAYAPIFDEHGNVVAVLGTDRDIEDMKNSIAKTTDLLNIIFIISFSVIVLFIFLHLLFTITIPMRSLTHTIGEIGAGKKDVAVSRSLLRHRNEIGILAHTLKHTIDSNKTNTGHLENAFNSLDAMICVTDPSTDTILFVNDYMRQQFKLQDDCVGTKCHSTLRGFDKRCDFCPCTELDKDSDKAVIWEQSHAPSKRLFRTFSRYIKWPDGRIVHLQHAVDITDIMQTQKELTDHNVRLSLLISSMNIALWNADADYTADNILNPDNEIQYSDELLGMFGYSSEEFPSTLESWFEKIHPDDFEMVIERVSAHFEDATGTTPFDVEYRMRLKNGQYKWFRAFGATLRSSEGKPLRVIGATEDIDERKNAEREITDKNEMIQTMFDNAPVGLTVFEQGLKFVDCNDNILNTFGISKELYGRYFTENLYSPDYQADGMKSRDKALALEKRVLNGEKIKLDWLHSTPDGSPLQVELTLVRAKQNGRYVALGYAYDMREQVSLKNELEQALHKAEAANHAKGVFLANMSHEIRTPMNAILGITEIELQKGTLPQDSMVALSKIHDSGDLLLNIINDILDFSKIEEGKLEIMPTKYSLPNLINETVHTNLMRYDNKLIRFILDVNENTPVDLFGDKLRIKQILNNLLSNALKYTDKGQVRLSVWSEAYDNDDGDDCIKLIFEVQDTGRGMTSDQIGKLFQEYTRFNIYINRTIQGTGLGLSITKRLLDLMDGEISVTSRLNKGSTFTVYLPQKRVNDIVCGREIADQLKNLKYNNAITSRRNRRTVCEQMPYGRVLIVDDMESNIYVTKGMLAPYGLQIESTKSGIDAIKKIEDGESYDIIFMDYMMPKMNGMEATKILRNMGYKKPIAALTANALTGQAELFLKNGFDAFISKPIDSRVLNSVLTKYVSDKGAGGEMAGGAQADVAVSSEAGGGASVGGDAAGDVAVAGGNSLSELERFFIIDAHNTIMTLEGLLLTLDSMSEAEISDYRITVHGIKNALSGIGRKELSAMAASLENAVAAGDISYLSSQTPVLITELKVLLEQIESDNA